NFTLYAYFKSGSVTGDKVSSYSDKIQNSISLDSSKTYYFLQSGSVNSNHYSCGYSSVESSITTPYRIEIEP
ncbi:MAG: hypothetical protein KDK36_11305, partial [Leptospiraceae bacterium]|nr:hypothetical protein [Leptospiraceae bacterium]